MKLYSILFITLCINFKSKMIAQGGEKETSSKTNYNHSYSEKGQKKSDKNVIIVQKTKSSLKFAKICLDNLISIMPETKIAREAAQNYLKGIDAESISMQTELETKYKDYMERQATMSDLLRKTREDELNQLQRRVEEFKQQAQIDYQLKTEELTAPIMGKVKKGIEAVAKEFGYQDVIDTSDQENLIFLIRSNEKVTPGSLNLTKYDDILNQVKKKLDSMPLIDVSEFVKLPKD
jgi:outer membrane protein